MAHLDQTVFGLSLFILPYIKLVQPVASPASFDKVLQFL